MSRFVSRYGRTVALAVVATLALAGPAVAGDSVPYSGAFAGSYTVTPIPDTPTAKLVVDGGGVATQLGLFAIEIPHVVNFANLSAVGTYRITAANGDELHGTFTGQSTPIGTEGLYVLVTENVTITGGTGRFLNATGEFTTVRLVDRANLRTAGTFAGSISCKQK